MRVLTALHLAAPAALLLLVACASTERKFLVTSFPPGADIFRADEPDPVGRTPRLVTVSFAAKRFVPIRVDLSAGQEDTSYEPAGTVVTLESPEQLFFFLKPDHSQELRALLEGIDRKLTRIEKKK